MPTEFDSVSGLATWWQESMNFVMPVYIARSEYPLVTLTDDECDEIIGHCNMRGYNIRRTLGRGSRDVHPSKELQSIQKAKKLALEINRLTFGYDLDENNFECVVHKFQNGMGYHFHRDCNQYRPYCKLGVSVQLSNPKDHVGGDLVFFGNGDPAFDHVIPRERGSMAVFPAFNPHKVATIESGVRYSMIFFFYGPPFR